MSKDQPIGVFDSGVGGLTIMKELIRLLPDEEFVYVADSGHAPYGSKSQDFIIERSRWLTEYLIHQQCKAIVVACNTATGAAISVLRQKYNLPFIGVEPAIKPAVEETKTGHVGVLATEQTFQGEHFQRTSGRFAQDVQFHVQAGYGLVEWIEEGMTNRDEIIGLIRRYINPMLNRDVDQLVLGCTHYPLLIPIIQEMLPSDMRIHDPSEAVARQTRKILEEKNLLSESIRPSKLTIQTTGNEEPVKQILEVLGIEAALSRVL